MDYGYVGRHAGLQIKLRVGYLDHHVVGNHVLHHNRRYPYLEHLALKDLVRIGVHGELYVHALPYPSYVSLRNARIDLHLGKVLGNGKKRGGLKTRGNRLSHVHVSRNHDSLNGRDYLRVSEV